MHRQPPQPRHRRLAPALLAMAALAAACTTAPPPANATATRTTPPTRAQLAAYAVTLAYQEFWIVLGLIDQQPTTRWPGILGAVATDPELTRQLTNATNRRAHGLRHDGEPISHITTIDGALTTTATLTDCQDTTPTADTDAANHHHPGTVARQPVIATLTRPTDYGTWRVRDLTYPPGAC
jgi:hypothetical protein